MAEWTEALGIEPEQVEQLIVAKAWTPRDGTWRPLLDTHLN